MDNKSDTYLNAEAVFINELYWLHIWLVFTSSLISSGSAGLAPLDHLIKDSRQELLVL